MSIDLGQISFGQIRRSEHLPARIAVQLAEEISQGRLKPGERLPTEHVLAKTLGVSRSVVREAIAQLRNEGVVETRQGVGAFVHPHADVERAGILRTAAQAHLHR